MEALAERVVACEACYAIKGEAKQYGV